MFICHFQFIYLFVASVRRLKREGCLRHMVPRRTKGSVRKRPAAAELGQHAASEQRTNIAFGNMDRKRPPQLRFLNMQPEQVQRRDERQRKRVYRARTREHEKRRTSQKKDSVAAEHTHGKKTPRKYRPCCGKQMKNCTCRPPSGMKRKQLTSLAERFAETALSSVRDTTDVSVWQAHMQPVAEQLPMRVLLAYAHAHVVFNQEPLLKAFIDRKAFLFKAPWFDWQLLQSIVQKHKSTGNICRSSNYRSTTLKQVVLQSHQAAPRQIQSNPVARDVLACRIVSVDAMPAAICDLYDVQPSRDLWKAIMLTWLERVHNMCAGCFSDYYLKCTLDRLLAVRRVDHGTISWWPTMCPAYQSWFERLYPGKNLSPEEMFQVLCTTYSTLSQYKTCTITEALAQTCWAEKDRK